jgi:hypothetical protein
MSAVYLPVGSLIYLNSTIKLSEHSRQPVSLAPNRIEKSQRMSNGSLRKFYIADKQSLSVSWTKLPSFSTFTIDGGYGAVDLENFYNGTATKASGALSGQSTFDVTISYGGTTKTLQMAFQSFSLEVINRNVKQKSSDTPQEFWNVSFTLEEV